VVQHARRLSLLQGWDVTLVMVREQDDGGWQGYEDLASLQVRSRTEALDEHYDIAVATWWETTFTLFEMSAERYAYFVQSLEDRFYDHDKAERLGASITLDLPVAFITEARWIVETLSSLRPDARCYLVRNGVDKSVFAVPESVEPSLDAPLRILVEGSASVWHKQVPEAISAVSAMREPHHLTVVSGDPESLAGVAADRVVGPVDHAGMAELYREVDVVVKLSRVEGMSGPPLEGFHCGATCVVTPVTGHEEYVEHGFNGLITDWDDPLGTARQLDLLARDRSLLHFVRSNAVETARAWPDWEQSSQFMTTALLTIAREPQPDAVAPSAHLLADLRAGIDAYSRHLEAVRWQPVAHWLLGLRRYRIVRVLSRPLRPLIRRYRQRH